MIAPKFCLAGFIIMLHKILCNFIINLVSELTITHNYSTATDLKLPHANGKTAS